MWESSRGGRELESWAHLLNTCRDRGVLVHVTSHESTYDVRKARHWKTLADEGVRSADETNQSSIRILDGKAEGRMAGRPQGGIAYGIHRVRDPEKRKHAFIRDEPDPDTGPIAAEIVRRVGAREAYVDIVRDLNGRIPSPKGGDWTPMTIIRIAGNPAYVAAGVVTQAESNAARARIAESKGQGSGKGERFGKAVLRYSYVMRCSVCGGGVKGHLPSYGAPRYQCGGHHEPALARGTAWISAARADEWIDEMAVKWLSQPVALALLETGDDTGAREALDEADRYQVLVDEARAEAESGNLDPDELMMKVAAVKGWTRKAEDARSRAQELATPSPLAGLPDEDEAMVRAHWEALSTGARKVAVRAIFPHLVLVPGGQDVPVDQRIKPEPEV